MCGIAGGWLPNGFPPDALAAALESLRHRGPDDVGELLRPQVSLGIRRLSIIDLEGGAQPLSNEDRSIAAVCNGEIYNFVELRRELQGQGHEFRTRSDAEVLVHLYERDGEDLCRSLRGMYAFAIWDARTDTLLLARDRFGKKPLYWTRGPEGGLLFASELKGLRPLALAAGLPWQISPQAIYDYLSLGVVPQPTTAFDGVEALAPATVLTLRDGRLRQHRYWRLDWNRNQISDYGEAVAAVRGRLGEAVRLRLRSDVPLGVFLSGGVDSSIIAYESSRELRGDLQTFTVALTDRRFDESGTAARTAAALGVRNEVLHLAVSPLHELQHLVSSFDQPFADPSAIPTQAVSRLAREHVKVVLSGDGGDETFAGYRRYLAADWLDRLGRLGRSSLRLAGRCLPSTVDRRSALGFAKRFARGVDAEPGLRYLTWTLDMLFEADKRPIWRGGTPQATEDRLAGLIRPDLRSMRRQMDADLQVNLLSDLLVKMDIASMAASLEVRSPLLDHRLAELVAGLPHGFLLRRGRRKALLRDAYRGRVPDEVLDGPKRGFEIPLASWLEEELADVVSDTLGSNSARVTEYLRPDAIADLVQGRGLEDRNRPYIVYALLVLELWLRTLR